MVGDTGHSIGAYTRSYNPDVNRTLNTTPEFYRNRPYYFVVKLGYILSLISRAQNNWRSRRGPWCPPGFFRDFSGRLWISKARLLYDYRLSHRFFDLIRELEDSLSESTLVNGGSGAVDAPTSVDEVKYEFLVDLTESGFKIYYCWNEQGFWYLVEKN